MISEYKFRAFDWSTDLICSDGYIHRIAEIFITGVSIYILIMKIKVRTLSARSLFCLKNLVHVLGYPALGAMSVFHSSTNSYEIKIQTLLSDKADYGLLFFMCIRIRAFKLIYRRVHIYYNTTVDIFIFISYYSLTVNINYKLNSDTSLKLAFESVPGTNQYLGSLLADKEIYLRKSWNVKNALLQLKPDASGLWINHTYYSITNLNFVTTLIKIPLSAFPEYGA